MASKSRRPKLAHCKNLPEFRVCPNKKLAVPCGQAEKHICQICGQSDEPGNQRYNAFIQGRAECGQMRSAGFARVPWNFLLAAET